MKTINLKLSFNDFCTLSGMLKQFQDMLSSSTPTTGKKFRYIKFNAAESYTGPRVKKIRTLIDKGFDAHA